MFNFGEGLGEAIALGNPVNQAGMNMNSGPSTVAVAQPESLWDSIKNNINEQKGKDILGMTPDSFSAIAGGVGTAVSNPKSWQARMGTLARGIGVASMAQQANTAKMKADQAFTQKLLSTYPQLATQLSAQTGQHPDLSLNGHLPANTGTTSTTGQ